MNKLIATYYTALLAPSSTCSRKSLNPFVFSLQKISGWLKSPIITRACKCDVSSSHLKKASAILIPAQGICSSNSSHSNSNHAGSPVDHHPSKCSHLAPYPLLDPAPSIPAALSHKGQIILLSFLFSFLRSLYNSWTNNPPCSVF